MSPTDKKSLDLMRETDVKLRAMAGIIKDLRESREALPLPKSLGMSWRADRAMEIALLKDAEDALRSLMGHMGKHSMFYGYKRDFEKIEAEEQGG